MTVAEPVTLLTDYLLAALTAFFAFRLTREGMRLRQVSVLFWGAGFFASAAAAAAGGTFHGFFPVLSPLLSGAFWKFTVYSIGVASLGLSIGAMFAATAGRVRQWLIGVAGIKFLIYAAWMLNHDEFRFVIYDYAPALFLVLVLQLPGLLGRRPEAVRITFGILVCFAAAGIQMSGWSLHRHFNHNDLYHVVQMGAFFLLYRGGLLLRDRKKEET